MIVYQKEIFKNMELNIKNIGAGNEVRTRDLNLGKGNAYITKEYLFLARDASNNLYICNLSKKMMNMMMNVNI